MMKLSDLIGADELREPVREPRVDPGRRRVVPAAPCHVQEGCPTRISALQENRENKKSISR